MHADAVVALIALGAAAGLAGMIWPFRRGPIGVVLNFVAGIGGALAGGLLGFAVMRPSGRSPTDRMIFAAAGALIVLIAIHALALRKARSAHRSVQ